MVRKSNLLLLLFLFFWGCSPSSPSVRKTGEFSPKPEKEVLFVIPFTTVMVPAEVEEGIFDLFVDALNERSTETNYEFIILKGGADGVDSAWLADQHYLTGEIFGYVEDSGCCSTSIRIKSRVHLHQPGSDQPTLVLEYPREIFFDHDFSTIEAERSKLAGDVATTLAGRLIDVLTGS